MIGWVLEEKMEDFSGFEGSGRDIVLAEPRPSEAFGWPGRRAGRGMP